MFVATKEILSITDGFVLRQVHATMGTLDHILDLFFRALVSGLFAVAGTAYEDDHNPDGEGDKYDT